jgi:hypothetical protein
LSIPNQKPETRRAARYPASSRFIPAILTKPSTAFLKNTELHKKEATFCLLDQRTFECHWATLQKLAEYKKPPNHKIELLYFLGVGWLHRALAGIRKSDKARLWWGKQN